MRIDTGVWTAQDSAMIRNVTQSDCSRPGSDSAARQLVRPDGWIGPMPGHVVKLSATTPISGMIPKATNKSSAGRAIHATDPPRPPVAVVGSLTRTAGGASAVICR